MRITPFLMAAFIAMPLSVYGAQEKNLEIGRMKVTVMPEYDTQEVLVVQEGKFADLSAFPSEVTFDLPKDVTQLTDACSLSPQGQHFCQIYDIKSGDKGKYVDLMLPYSDFFLDYKYAPFTPKDNSKRNFSFDIDSRYGIKSLEIHVQKPWRAEDFNVALSGSNLEYKEETYEKKGFQYAKYVMKNVRAGDIRKISVGYFKPDTEPSVDAKYSSMTRRGGFEENNGNLFLGLGIFALGIIIIIKRRRGKPVKAASGESTQ